MTLRALTERNDIRFEDNTYELRRFDVKSRVDDEKIGEVDDVIVDDAGRVRYLSVKLEGDRRLVLLPVGQARTDRANRTIWVSGMRLADFRSIPTYEGTAARIDRDSERRVADAYERAHPEEHFYERPEYRTRTSGTTGQRRASGNLERLDQLDDIDVASGEPDPRGWKVVANDGRNIGEVDHLIGDLSAMKVRYLVVKLDRDIASDRHEILIPIGHVSIDDRRNNVRLDAIDSARLKSFPRYTGETITRDYERQVNEFFVTGYTGRHEYRHPRYRDEHFWDTEARIPRTEEEMRVGKMQRPAGSVDVEKHVETEHVKEPVKVRHQEAEVERRPASRNARPGEIRDDEVHVPLTEEEVVVEKRPRVKEEIVVRRRNVEDTEYAEADLRKERIDVDRNDERNRR